MTGIEQQLEEEARHIMDDSDRKFLQGKKEKAMTADTPDIVDKVKNTLFAANLNIDEAPKLEVSNQMRVLSSQCCILGTISYPSTPMRAKKTSIISQLL